MAKPPRRLPFQLVLLMAMTGAMMVMVWLKLGNPAFNEGVKARQTAQYYLEALGRAPIDRLGAEIHPIPRSHFDTTRLPAWFAARQLDKPLTIKSWGEEHYQGEPQQWSWRIDVQSGAASFPILLSVRQPQEQTIARRWRMYALCLPQTELKVLAHQLLAGKTSLPKSLSAAAIKTFKPVPDAQWQLVSTEPPTLVIPGADKRLMLSYKAEPDGELGCDYTLTGAHLSGTTH